MAAILEIADDPALADQTAFNLAVWEKVLSDPFYNTLEHRIETNSFGQIIMSPPPNFEHGEYQFNIAYHLKNLLKNGSPTTECPISTRDGVRAADVVWISSKRRKLHKHSKGALTKAPEICVEVISPSNRSSEMTEKKSLYFEAGADEVWFCKDGQMTFFLAAAPDSPGTSKLCAGFPLFIEIDAQ